jgi:hypothetical protein
VTDVGVETVVMAHDRMARLRQELVLARRNVKRVGALKHRRRHQLRVDDLEHDLLEIEKGLLRSWVAGGRW